METGSCVRKGWVGTTPPLPHMETGSRVRKRWIGTTPPLPHTETGSGVHKACCKTELEFKIRCRLFDDAAKKIVHSYSNID